jgi:hypothetical protein
MSLLPLPDQSIPESEKTQEWHEDHVRDYVSFSNEDSTNNQREEILKLFRGYNAELSKEELELTKAVTCPHGTDLGQEYIVYPLIQSKIEQIVGEFMLRPLRRKAYVLDKASKNKKLEKKLEMATEQIMRDLMKDINPDLGFEAQTENAEMELPVDVEDFFEKDYKSIEEEVADGLLRLFLDVNKEKNKFRTLFTQYAICDRAHSILFKTKGHTSQRAIHPLDADYDLDPYKIVQDDHEYFFENYYLTENEVYNSYSLTKDQKLQVKDYFAGVVSDGENENSSGNLGISHAATGWMQTSNKTNRVRVVYAMWKSRKRTSIKISNNKEGKKFYKKMNEKDLERKPRKNEEIKHIDGEMPRHCVMLGPAICLEWGEMKERYSRIDAKWVCTLPVVSVVRDNTLGSSMIKSIAAKLYQLQVIASELLFEIRLALKSAGDSRVLVYDAAQTPKDFVSKHGFEGGLNRVMHHIKKDKLLIINSKEKGRDKNTFNQFTSLDLSQKGVLQDLFLGLGMIEDLASKFVGMAPEREGQVGQYQTATGTDRALRGSFARSEVIFTPFDEFVQAVLEKSIMKMKHDYEEGQVIQYIFGEMKTKFMKIFKEFFGADIGVYLSDASKDKDIAERIDRAAEISIGNSNTPEMMMGLIEIFEGESASEKKTVFKRILASLEEVRMENQKAQQAAQEQAAKQAQEEFVQKERISDKSDIKDIKVAHIYKSGKAEDTLNKNATQEKITSAKLDVEREKNRNQQNKEN